MPFVRRVVAWCAGGMSLSTHVLDTARGRPAAGVRVRLERREGDDWVAVAEGRTDGDGRLRDWVPDGEPGAGAHRLVFDSGQYLAERGTPGFYPEVTVTFAVDDPGEHYHVPLLLAPYGYSTYRGS